MSVSTPTLTFICCALAILTLNAAASAAKPSVRFHCTASHCLDAFVGIFLLHTKIIVQLLQVGIQFRIREAGR